MSKTQFERIATAALKSKEFKVFEQAMLQHFAPLAERAGQYVSRMCNRDREIVLQNALMLAWTLRDEFNPTAMSLTHYWDECLQGSVRMQKHWFIRAFDGWQRVTSEAICSMWGLPAFLSEEV